MKDNMLRDLRVVIHGAEVKMSNAIAEAMRIRHEEVEAAIAVFEAEYDRRLDVFQNGFPTVTTAETLAGTSTEIRAPIDAEALAAEIANADKEDVEADILAERERDFQDDPPPRAVFRDREAA